MVTLTYHGYDLDGVLLPEFGWQANNVRDLLKQVRDHLGDDLVCYAWTGELQKRGAMHYHLLLIVRQSARLPFPDKAGWWPHGSTSVLSARTQWYIAKYASKGHFQGDDGEWHEYPKGARIFAVWLNKLYFPDHARWVMRLSALPAWLSELLSTSFLGWVAKRQRGGGWTIQSDHDPPVFLRSPWLYVL